MKCLFPVPVDLGDHQNRVGLPTSIYVGCGKCYYCLQERRKSWFVRNLEELRSPENCFSTFVTLTYRDDDLPHDINNNPVFCKRDVQLFLHRFRKELDKLQCKTRYFLVSEYGDCTGRPHYHALFYHNKQVEIMKYSKILHDTWKHSDLDIDWHPLNEAEISYCCNYVLSYIFSARKNVERPFMLASRKPGLGAAFLENKVKVNDSFRGDFIGYQDFQNRYKLPRYYKDKILSDDDKFDIVENYLDYLEQQRDQINAEKQKFGVEEFYRKRIHDFWAAVDKGNVKLSKSKHKL